MAGPKPIRLIGLVLCIALLVGGVTAATTQVRVVKYANDRKTVLEEQTVDYIWLEAHLPVMGDGSTHYYHQNPTRDPDNLWDPAESKNLEDLWAVRGTAVREICDLVGGMSPGDTLVVRATDSVASKPFSYGTVYSPTSRQGQMVLTWYRAGDGYVPSYWSGMRVVFFADTSGNKNGWHVFGLSDMQASMPESEWTYNDGFPTTMQHSTRYVKELEIRSTQPPPTTATTRPTTATPTPPAITTQTTSSVLTTGTIPAVTTAATLDPTIIGTPTGAAPIAGNATLTTAPTADMGPGANSTLGPGANATAAVTTPDPAANLTGNVTPLANWTTVPTALPLETTYYYSAPEPTTDIDESSVENTTRAATVTPTATASPAAPAAPLAAITGRPSPPPALSSAPTAAPANRSISFTFSFEVKENGVGAAGTAAPAGASAAISPASPLGALWAFVRALVDLIDTFFT